MFLSKINFIKYFEINDNLDWLFEIESTNQKIYTILKNYQLSWK